MPAGKRFVLTRECPHLKIEIRGIRLEVSACRCETVSVAEESYLSRSSDRAESGLRLE